MCLSAADTRKPRCTACTCLTCLASTSGPWPDLRISTTHTCAMHSAWMEPPWDRVRSRILPSPDRLSSQLIVCDLSFSLGIEL